MPLDLPDVPESQLWETLKAALKGDPTLQSAVATWRTWEGVDEDDAPPTREQMPWIRLTPQPSRLAYSEVEEYLLTLRVVVELATAGTDANDILRLWGALRAALQRSKPFMGVGPNTIDQQLRLAGGCFYSITDPAIFPTRPPNADPPQADFRAAGAIVLATFVPA
jgi:hypothetical protein